MKGIEWGWWGDKEGREESVRGWRRMGVRREELELGGFEMGSVGLIGCY